MASSIEPYTISVPDSKLRRLAQKLEATEFPDELEQVGWDYGAPLADVKRLTIYWKDKYDWRAQEAKINELPNFKTTIQGRWLRVSRHPFRVPAERCGGSNTVVVLPWLWVCISNMKCSELTPSKGLVASSKSPRSFLFWPATVAKKPLPSTSSPPRYPTMASHLVPNRRVSAYHNMLKRATSLCSNLATMNT